MLLSTDLNFSDGTEKHSASIYKLKQHFKNTSISTIKNFIYSSRLIPLFLKKKEQNTFFHSENCEYINWLGYR